MRFRSRGVVAASMLLVAVALSGCAPRQPWQTELVVAGTNGGYATSAGGVFSPDGTKVLFQTVAGDLGPTDTNGESDVYLRDLASGTATLVSANGEGTDSGDGQSLNPGVQPRRHQGGVRQLRRRPGADGHGPRR
jgi:hypothetical protein